jgi:lysozyme
MLNTDIEKRNEGLRLVAYPDPGTGGKPWTIGYGHTAGVKKGDVATKKQAEDWLLADLRTAISTVSADVHVPLTDNEESALVDMVFNVGAENFESSTLLALLNANDYHGASKQFLRWNHANGRVLAGLTKRCAERKALFDKE